MSAPFAQFLRQWCRWGLPKVSPARRPQSLSVTPLEERLAPAFLGGVNTALGDLDGDGVLDLVTAAGPGGGPHVTAFSGATGEVIRSFYAFDTRFTGGVSVAVADVNGDGTPDIVAGAGEGGAPHVVVFDGRTNGVLFSEYVYLERFRGGVNVGAEDLDGDGKAELLTGAGVGGGPHVQAIDGTTGAVRRSFYAYEERFRGGATVTAGDITGDGVADFMTGAGPGGGPHVVVFDGATGEVWASHYAYTPSYSVGVRVTAGDVDGNGLADVTVAPMKDGGPHLRTFAGRQSVILDMMVEDPNYRGSLSAAVGDLDGDGFDDVMVGNGVRLPARVRRFNGYTGASGPAMTVLGDPPTVAPFAQAVPPLAPPIFDGPAFQIPASPLSRSTVTVTPKHRLTSTVDEVGFYRVDDADGRVGSLLPGDAGYAAAALADDRRLPFAPGGQFKAELPAGGWYAHYLIADSTHAEWAASNPTNATGGSPLAYFSFAAANPDDTTHLRYVRERNRFAWENQTRGDDDTNDFIGELEVLASTGQGNLELQRPTISDILDRTITVGTALPPFAFTVGDRETPAEQLAVTFTADNTTLLPAGSITLGGSGANRTLILTPAPGELGTATVTVTVTDANGMTASDTFTLTVRDLPQPPTISDILDRTITVGAALPPFAFTVGDRETPADQLNVTFTADNPTLLPAGSITLGGSGANRTLTLVPATGELGTATVTVTVTDADGMTASDTVTVTVIPVPSGNTPPTLSDVADRQIRVGTTTGPIPFTVDDRETPAGQLTLTVTSDNPMLLPSGAFMPGGNGANRTLTVTPTAGQSGTAVVTLTVSDNDPRGALTATDTFVLTVSDEQPVGNTPPTISDIPDQVTTTGTAVGPIPFTVDDAETPDQLTVTVTSDGPTLLPNSAFTVIGTGANRTIAFTPTAGLTGAATITVTVSDGFLTDTDTFLVTVNPPPVTIPPTTVFPTDLAGWTVAERGGTATRRGDVTATAGNATLSEGDSFVTTLSKSFVVPDTPTAIQFTYAGLNFDTSDPGFVNDAFEAALVDAAGNPLVPVYAVGRDAFFNVTDGNVVTRGTATTITGNTVQVDLTAVPAGTVATLVLRLVNNDADRGSTVTLASTALPTAGNADAATKFFVVDDGTDRTYRYGDEGLGAGTFATTGSGNASGAASNPAGDRVWVIDDTTKAVRVFGPTGTTLGSWTATDTVDPQGVTVDNGTLWLVDRGSLSVRRYVGGAGLTTGTATATDTFALDAANASPSDLVTDGGTVWVTDDATAEVFVYDVAGVLLGRWKLDGDNAAPSGITRNPAGGTDLWVLDRATKQVFQYGDGANLRAGQHTADGTFNLAPSNTSPEGIADPPTVTVVAPPDRTVVEAGTNVILSGEATTGGDSETLPPPVVTFEEIGQEGVPVDGQYLVTHGVSFGLEGGGVPVSVRRGGPQAGFAAADGADTPATGVPVGDSYLTVNPDADGNIRPLLIRYETPVAQAGGQILDIDARAAQFTVFESDGTPGYYNQSIGNRLDGTSFLFPINSDPTINNAPEPNLSAAAGVLGTWLTAAPPVGDAWAFRGIPTSWPVSTETAVVYEIDGGPGGVRNLVGNFGVDNGLFVWLNGVYKFGALAPGVAVRYEYSGIPLGDLRPGKNYLQLLREDHGVTNGFAVRITGELVPAEAWRVEALDGDGRPLETVVVGPDSPGAGDGRAAAWNFTRPTPDIATVRVTYVGTVASGADFAIDNVTGVPAVATRPAAITSVSVNGVPVEVLDAAGRFFDPVLVGPGENRYEVVATDSLGRSAATTVTLIGETRVPGSVDSSQFVDLSSGFKAEYGRTSYRQFAREMYADIAVRNVSNYPAGVPLYVAVKNISDPAVRVLDAAGTLPDGTPYYDFTGLVTGGGQLLPDALTGTLSLHFANPNRGRFTYDLVFLGVPNRPPAFTTIPELEATVGREYRYPAAATDPDRDPLAFNLVSGPVGMTVNETTGVVTWTPTATQLGNFPVTLRVSDGRGGTAEQTFTVVSAVSRPNHPPVFTTLPVIEAQAGQPYTYDADATDPDGDTLTYSLAAGLPAGMTIDENTGIITWTPTFAQIGDVEVTVIADDGNGGMAAQTFTICVKNDANRPPVIVSDPVRTVRADDTTSVTSTFNVDSDGWVSTTLLYPTPGSPPNVLGTVAPQFVATGGDPGGFVQVGDPDGSLPVGNTQYWMAPTKYLGNQSAAYGGSLSFDLIQTPTANPYSQEDVILVGGGLTLVHDTSANPSESWTSYNVGLSETGWKLNNLSGPAATQLQMRAVLSSITALYIRGEYELGPDVESLDNVVLRTAGSALYTYDVEALDPDGGTLTYSLTQKPDGMTIDPATGVISWAPARTFANQSVPVTVRADDGRGGSDEQKFTVTVKVLQSTAREFDPVVEWQKSTFTVRPDSNQVMMTPAVIDLNNDATPDIVYSTFSGSTYQNSGVLRAISGRDGTELWSVTDSAWLVSPGAGLAVGDIDGDGRPEVIALNSASNGLLAFEHDGTPKWASRTFGTLSSSGAALADLDGDGKPEIIYGGVVLNSDGSERWVRSSAGWSVVVDLDRDGVPEVVAGRTAYRADGTEYWSLAGVDGLPAVGNFDSDPFPEVVLTRNGIVRLVQHDGTLAWTVPLEGGGSGGPPTVADLDGDGVPEIGVAGGSRYVAYRANGSVLWRSPTQDLSSNLTGSSVFDFEGDGSAEVVYADELFFRIYRGSDGTVLYELPNPSGTIFEYPVITDVDNDGNAEIVLVANNYAFPGVTGIRVIGDRNNTWVDARGIWNQHSYHITNVNDDGTIPRVEANSWEVYNTYRLNVLTDGVDPRAAIDLEVTSLSRVGTGSPLTFTARVENTGNAPANAGMTLALYDGDPRKGGVPVGSAVTTQRLRPNEGETLTIALTVAAVNDLWAMADPANLVAEFDDDNNALRGSIDTDPVNYAPRLWREITPTELVATANTAFPLPLPVVDPDGDAISYTLVTGPDGLLVHPTLGVVAWVAKRGEIGTHQVVVKAADAAGNETLVPLTVTVVAPNTAPVITSTAPVGQATVGQKYEYRATAQEAETLQAELRYSLHVPLPGMAIDAITGVFTWTPTAAQVGARTVNVVVTDGTTSTEQTFTLNVLATSTNRNPVISVASADTSAWLGRGYGAQATATDADGDPVRFELVSGPAGMTVDPDTGVVRWTPTAVTTAPLTVEVRAADGRGGVATVSFAVSVYPTDRNRTPQVVSVPPRVVVHGGLYAYDLVARDPDGDQVLWQLVSGPQGVSLDPLRGTLRWTPAADQTGPHTIVVRAVDPLLAAGEQTFTVVVACENQPPNVVSRPPTVAYANDPYLYAVRAVDAEDDPLVFELESGPAGMAFVPGTSLLRWTPTLAQAGPQSVVVKVTDTAGNVARQSFTVVVSTETPNRPPVITSRPPTNTTAGRPYSYAVAARDPDGDPLTYTLTDKPDGMAISPTGVITWNPTVAESHAVTVEVTDARGGLAVQSFTFVARANQAPSLTPLPDAAVPVGGTFRGLVRATDPENDPLTFALTQAPAGMSIDAQGRLAWTATGSPRAETVRVTVSDPFGLTVTDEFVVNVVADTQAPVVGIVLSRPRADIGTTVQVTVSATDNVGIASRTLTADGVHIALDSQGRAFFPAALVGRVTFAATATDPSGNVGTATAELVVIDPSLASGVRTDITRLDLLTAPGTYRQVAVQPDTPVTVSYLTDVIGTVETLGQPIAEWRLLLARADLVDVTAIDPDSPAWQVIGSGTAPVANGKLATFDPTLLTNDRYVLALVAYDVLGAGFVKPVEVDVVGNAKLGDFRLEFTDLSLPLNGIPITVTRVYDTKEAGTSKDFGFGWTLGLRDARIRETVPADVSLIPDKSKVYLTAPDGSRVGFTYKERFVGGFPSIGAVYAPYFVADPGNTYALTLPSDQYSGRGGAIGGLGEGINPTHYRLTTPDGVAYDYDQFAGLQKITDRNGNTVTFTDTAITHSGGRVITLERDGQSRITAIRLPDGSVAVRYRYDAKGDLVEVKQVTQTAPVEKALQSTVSYKADRPHYLDEYVDANGQRAVKTDYDASGRLVRVTDADGHVAEQDFSDLANFAETVKDKRGNPTAITYNDRGNVTMTVQPTEFGDVVTLTLYEDAANPDKETKVVNGRGFTTTSTFDASGNRLTETTTDGTTTYKYNALNKLTQVTDTLGRTTVYDYNTAGNLIRVIDPRGDGSTFEYDNLGRVKKFVDFAGNVTLFDDYCACGRPLTTINPDGSIRKIETNGYSQVTKVTDERGNVTLNEYDNQGRLVSVTDGEGKKTRYEYEGANQVRVIDPLGNITTTGYDAAGNKNYIKDAEGGETFFTHDGNGNLETVKDPVGNVTRFVYDKANRLMREIEEFDPQDPPRLYEYDSAGNRVKATDRNGRVRTFEYDALNRQTAEKWLDANGAVVRNITSEYDKAGNLLKTADPDAVLTYTYDSMNRVKTATTVYVGTAVPSVTLTYEYDKNGNHKSVVDNTGVRIDSVYDNRNRLESRTWSGGGIDAAKVVYDYYDNGERKSLTRYADATGTTKIGSSTYDYWKNGLSKTITHADGTGAVLAGYSYQYDDAGRLKQETHHGDTYVYGYDKTGQLKTVTVNGVLTESFSYDANGNRKTSSGPNGSQTYSAPGAGNRLLNDGLFAYTYDGEGNLTTKTELSTGNVTAYTWDHRNRLVKVEQRTGGGVILSVSEYVYDAQNRRIAQITNGTALFTVYDREHAWADYTVAGAVANRFLFGDGIDDILARWTPGTGTAWHLSDKLGTVRDVVNAAGAVVNHIDYSAFGEILAQTNAAAGDRFTFTGREWDAAIGDYFYRARYYDPTSGRFTAVDPIGFYSRDRNLFRYVANVPTRFRDPSGNDLIGNVIVRVQLGGAGIAGLTKVGANILCIVLIPALQIESTTFVGGPITPNNPIARSICEALQRLH